MQHDQNNIVGDLYVTIDVDFPKGEFSGDQRESNVGRCFSVSHFYSSSSSCSHQESSQSGIQTSTVQWPLNPSLKLPFVVVVILFRPIFARFLSLHCDGLWLDNL